MVQWLFLDQENLPLSVHCFLRLGRDLREFRAPPGDCHVGLGRRPLASVRPRNGCRYADTDPRRELRAFEYNNVPAAVARVTATSTASTWPRPAGYASPPSPGTAGPYGSVSFVAPRLLPNHVADAVDFGNLRFTDTAANHAATRPYVDSPLTLEQIVRAADPVPDPGGLPNGWKWEAPADIPLP